MHRFFLFCTHEIQEEKVKDQFTYALMCGERYVICSTHVTESNGTINKITKHLRYVSDT